MGDKIVKSKNLCCQPVVFPSLSLLNWSKNRDNYELGVGCDGRDKDHNKTLKSKI